MLDEFDKETLDAMDQALGAWECSDDGYRAEASDEADERLDCNCQLLTNPECQCEYCEDDKRASLNAGYLIMSACDKKLRSFVLEEMRLQMQERNGTNHS